MPEVEDNSNTDSTMVSEQDFPPVLPSQEIDERKGSSVSDDEEYVEEEVDLDALPFWERPYYWQLVGMDTSQLPRWQKAWHVSRWVGSKIFFGMEFVGEVVAELVGLNQSRYQWVIDTMAEDVRRERRKEEIKKYREQMIQDGLMEEANIQSDAAEGGQIDASDDDAEELEEQAKPIESGTGDSA